MKQFKKSQAEAVFRALSQNAELFLPMQTNEHSGFFSWNRKSEEDTVLLDALNVYLPPKSVLIPPSEKMYIIHQDKEELKVEPVYENTAPTIIFGARSCDVEAIRCLDEVFLTRGFEDAYYKVRRENCTIVANACYEPGPHCFCKDMGVEPVAGSIADGVIKDVGDVWLWEERTDKGAALGAVLSSILEDSSHAEPQLKAFTNKADFAGLPELLPPMFEHPIWDELAEPCGNCGICTYLCPSCYCFDIQVKMWGNDGYRFRCYDSCMYGEYSLMAGGHNPRPTGKERFRNRY
ncbi:MAG: 4Fe-4S dicluster domain-containing protein, partial [Syntrophomonadaceae bacterium]|nr:4Fe-4S dicluster domain-containing protein [Syntrophomonadaceae bacterium]